MLMPTLIHITFCLLPSFIGSSQTAWKRETNKTITKMKNGLCVKLIIFRCNCVNNVHTTSICTYIINTYNILASLWSLGLVSTGAQYNHLPPVRSFERQKSGRIHTAFFFHLFTSSSWVVLFSCARALWRCAKACFSLYYNIISSSVLYRTFSCWVLKHDDGEYRKEINKSPGTDWLYIPILFFFSLFFFLIFLILLCAVRTLGSFLASISTASVWRFVQRFTLYNGKERFHDRQGDFRL